MPASDWPSWRKKRKASFLPLARGSTRSTSAYRRCWIQRSTSCAINRIWLRGSGSFALHEVGACLVTRPVGRQNLYVSDCRRRHRIDDAQSPALVRQVEAAVNNVRCVLNRLLRSVVLDFRQGLVGETNLGRRFFAELEAHHLGAQRYQPAFHWRTRREGEARIRNEI